MAGVSKVSALKRTTEVVKHRDGGDPSTSRKSPGRTEYEAITLERGVTHDPEFEKWANKVWNFGAGLGGEISLKDFRKDIMIEVYNEAGQMAIAYKVYRCWVSEFQALPDLDANANAVAIQTHQARERGLGARPRGGGADRAHADRMSGEPEAALTEADLLEAWEEGAALPRSQRVLPLLRRGGAATGDDVLHWPLGRHDALLLDLHERVFGATLDRDLGVPGLRRGGRAVALGRPASHDPCRGARRALAG